MATQISFIFTPKIGEDKISNSTHHIFQMCFFAQPPTPSGFFKNAGRPFFIPGVGRQWVRFGGSQRTSSGRLCESNFTRWRSQKSYPPTLMRPGAPWKSDMVWGKSPITTKMESHVLDIFFFWGRSCDKNMFQ